MVVIMCRSET